MGRGWCESPAGGLIPEAQFLAMTQPPIEPPRPPPPVASPAQQRLRKLIGSIESLIEAEPDGHTRRRKMDPIILRHVADEIDAGAERPNPVPQIGALTPVGIAVAVELGAEWIGRGKALGWTSDEAEKRAVAAVAEWLGKFHPEKATKVAAHPDEIRIAIRAWLRGKGRPAKGEYQGTKWDALANLCQVAGIGGPDKEALKQAWKRSERK